jgi:hypothetical protein
MLIPNKFNGYSRDGRRLYHFGGGGGGDPAPPPPPPPPPPRMDSAAPPPVFQTYGSGNRTGSLVQSGNSFRPSTLDYSKPIYDPNYADNITGYQESSQFYQPIYQSQQTNYATTNPLGVSQYGTPMTNRSLVDSAYAGIGRYGSGNETNQVDPGGRQYWESQLASGSLNPQSFFGQFSNAVNQARQNPNERYGQYYQNQTGYGGGYQGYMPQMQSPFSYQQPAQQMNWQTGQMMQPAQSQMQTPFSYQQPMQQMQQPMAQTNYGPSQAIVGRSSQMRGTPNVMRRAEGGIASLLDNDE